MSVEVIAIGGYEEVGKPISAKPLEKPGKQNFSAPKISDFGGVSSKLLIRNFRNYRLKAQIPKKLAMEAKT